MNSLKVLVSLLTKFGFIFKIEVLDMMLKIMPGETRMQSGALKRLLK